VTESLRGRVALVTGASRRRGIGTAICHALAGRGADVFFTHWVPFDRTQPVGADPETPDALRAELRSVGVRAESVEIDLSLPESPERLLDAATERLGAPSILVNNAAYSTRDGFENLDARTLDAHYAVNVRAMALLSVGFARRYPGGPGGRIINLTSGQSLGPMPGELAYAATKGAIEAFTVTLAAEVGYKGITINAVNPGPTDTGWMTEEIKRDLAAKFPSGRVGEPEDAARLVAFLAGDEARWITGQILHSEGGFLRS
jgi:3-oxoacyl-[acyl-carrier protein] reductase